MVEDVLRRIHDAWETSAPPKIITEGFMELDRASDGSPIYAAAEHVGYLWLALNFADQQGLWRLASHRARLFDASLHNLLRQEGMLA